MCGVVENNAILCKHSRLPESRIINFDANSNSSTTPGGCRI